jgi:hypothetical protein
VYVSLLTFQSISKLEFILCPGELGDVELNECILHVPCSLAAGEFCFHPLLANNNAGEY